MPIKVVEKPKIYASGNENLSGEFNISYYIIEKDSSFLDWLGDLLVQVLEISEGKHKAKFITKNKEDKDGAFIGQDVYMKDIRKMTDLHEHFENNQNRVDLFYGKERVYLTFRKTKEARQKLAQFLERTRTWIEVKEVKELPLHAGEKIEQ